jgi:hypothetical protein
MTPRTFSAALAALSLLCVHLAAQDTRARVQGVVTDSTQAVIGGATVTLRNNNTGVQAQQATSQTGTYLFDYVLPGTYTVLVEMAGFKQFVQQNVLVQARGDITVNAALEVGAAAESVTVEATPVAVQFNTTTMALTLDTKMANSLPVVSRNPFLLVALNPATVIRSSNEQSPFHHWSPNEFDVGGNTNRKNDIILDGAPSMTAQKQSYTPPMDAVQEVNLQQNSVDAEFGHSAGGVISMQMKSGTNDYHGTGYFLGRNPALNALADRITRGKNLTKQSVWGATIGGPIMKNRLFTFFAYEGWRTIEPKSVQYTLPTDLERAGDFSRSLNTQGNLRVIHDPFSTQTSGNVVTRTPFAGNVIPANRIDPTAKIVLNDLWKPNSPGTGTTGVNNFLAGYANRFRYYNFMDRVDWNINDRWKIFGRFNQFRTFTKWDDFTGGSVAQPVDGSKRHSLSFSGDSVYTLNATTVFNVRFGYNAIVDSFGVPEATLQEADLAKFWGNNTWYKPYLADLPDIYYPGMTINAASQTVLGKTGYWYQEPDSYNIESKISKSLGRHYMKLGAEHRREIVNAARPRPMSFVFNPAHTANTYNAPNTALSGDGWATFQLGVIDNGSNIQSIPIQRPRAHYTGLFFQDDFKLTQRLTLNLGLRYEYYTAMRDPEYRLSRELDLNSPIPELQGTVLPAQATALRTAAPIYNGAWLFTDEENPYSWNAPRNLFLPRAGLAWRVDNNTALRIGWARFIIPSTLTDGLDILGSVFYPGYDAITTALNPLQGVPQQRLNDPFPSGLVPVTGNSFGRYTNLGGVANWYQQDFNPGVNDRFNVSVQRQLPGRIVADITFFVNTGRDLPYTFNFNQIDPRIGYQIGNAVTTPVPNPFFNKLPANQMPGQLRTTQNIAVRELTRLYPQYGDLNERLSSGIKNRYKSLQMQFQRPFANGFNFVIGYNYNREQNLEFYDEQDTYLRNLTWQPARNARHRLTGAAIYELPFGRGRKYMSGANAVVDGILGGWSISGLMTYNSGLFLRFGGLLVSGNPTLDNPTKERWFDTSVFRQLPAFTRRENPLQFDDLTGPRFINFDATVGKEFVILPEGRLKFELRGEAYNLVNRFPAADPNLTVTSPNFGQVISQRAGVFGRQIQYSGRFIF